MIAEAAQPTHTSLVELFADIRAFVRRHPGATVGSVDDAMTRQLGWVALETESGIEHSERFSMSLSNLKAALAELAPHDPLRSEIRQPDGRRRIAERLMNPAPDISLDGGPSPIR